MPDPTPDPKPDPTPDLTPDPVGSAEPDGRERLLRSLRSLRGTRGQVTAAALLAALGFAAVTQVKANEQDDQYVGARQGDLVQYINNLSLASQRTESEIARLQRTRDALQSDTQARRTALERAQQQADTLGILAGTLPAVGTGVEATVRDTKGGAVGSNQLIEGLQELRDAGAEAIEINDKVRVVAQTSVRDSAGGVVVDGEPLEAPYVIEAIGNSHSLARGIDFAGGFGDEVRRVGGQVDVAERDRIEINTVTDPTTPKYAQPVP